MTVPRFNAAADAVARLAKANISRASDSMAQGDIELNEWYRDMRREVKMLHMAEAALARGGWDNMRPQDWERVEKIISEQFNGSEGDAEGKGAFPGLRKFAEDVRDKRYGDDPEDLRRGFLSRSNSYSDAGRSTFQNEQILYREEGGHDEARRILADVEHCPDCIAWAALGWIPIKEMYEKYPIGRSVCNVHCYCSIVTRKRPLDGEEEIEIRFGDGGDFSEIGMEVDWEPEANAAGVLSTSKDSDKGGVERMPNEFTAAQVDRLVPPRVHPYEAGGVPVSNALNLPKELDSVRYVLDALGEVHGDGNLDALMADALHAKLGKARDIIGEYIGGEIPELRVHPNGPTPGLTLLHETGHWLDDRIFGKSEVVPGRYGMGNLAAHSELKGLREAIERSDAVKRLKKYQKKTTIRGTELGRNKKVPYDVDGEHVEYLLSDSELFARAYSQYVAIRSGDSRLRRELAARLYTKRVTDIGGRTRDSLYYPEQWKPEDFENISLEFDKLFLSKGWLK